MKKNQNNKINPKLAYKKEDSEATKLKQSTKRKESEPNLQKNKKIWTDLKKEKNPESSYKKKRTPKLIYKKRKKKLNILTKKNLLAYEIKYK